MIEAIAILAQTTQPACDAVPAHWGGVAAICGAIVSAVMGKTAWNHWAPTQSTQPAPQAAAAAIPASLPCAQHGEAIATLKERTDRILDAIEKQGEKVDCIPAIKANVTELLRRTENAENNR